MSDQLMVSGTGLNRPIISFQSLHPPMQLQSGNGIWGSLYNELKPKKQSGNGIYDSIARTLKPTPEKIEKFKKALYVKKFADTIGLTGK